MESSGPATALKYMEKLQKKVEETNQEDKLSTLQNKFARTPVFQELYEDLEKLGKLTYHPKIDRLKHLKLLCGIFNC